MPHAELLTSLAALPGRDKTGGGRKAHCPAHEDRHASLSVDLADDGRILLHCLAGCRPEAIVSTLGFAMSDLYPEPARPANGAGPVRIVGGRRPASSGDHSFEARCTDGSLAGIHRRTDDGAGDKRIWWEPRGVDTKRLALFRCAALATGSDPVVIVEGERAAITVAAAGLTAVGTYGTSALPSAEALEPLRGRTVVLWPDADASGRQHMDAVAAALEGVAAAVRVVALPDDVPKGWDAADTDAETILMLVSLAQAGTAPFPEPEDRGGATLSALGEVEYVEDLVRPGRIVVWAAEEGSCKSYAVAGELAIRVAVAGGTFAGTWPVTRTGPVLVLSEMHSDDDYLREDIVLASLGVARADLSGRYYRLDLMTAAAGQPVLVVDAWRTWATTWMRDHDVLLLVVDTATGASQIDPWGRQIQTVYSHLRMMLAVHPGLAIVLVVHLSKPKGHGSERRISDVLGEWGRWCDVVVIQENDGSSLERTKLTTRKRVRHQRRIVATKRDGLLVDALDAETSGLKVSLDDAFAAIEAHPGSSYSELGQRLGVSKDTAANYVRMLGERVVGVPMGPRRSIRVYPASDDRRTAPSEPPSAVPEREPERGDATAEQRRTDDATELAEMTAERRTAPNGAVSAVVAEGSDRRSGPPSLTETGGLRWSAPAPPSDPDAPKRGASVATVACQDYRAHQSQHYHRPDGTWSCRLCGQVAS